MGEMLWVVGRFLKETAFGNLWSIQGVFDSEEVAVTACRDETYFIGPILKNNRLPHEIVEWHGVYYPLVKEGL